ncbi:MAG: hypothetical protein M3404_10595 [Actinomycetota bacterium]|nr:hypothetical protein [Actinomycetota bacterium]
MTRRAPGLGFGARPPRRSAVMALLFLAVIAVSTPAHGAQGGEGTQGGEFSLRPVRPANAATRERAYVVRTVRPGEAFDDRLEALNLTNRPAELAVEAVDAAITADGAFAPGSTRSAEGGWLSVTPDRVRVPPRGRAPVAVRVQVPADASPGDHIAAVVVQRADPPRGEGNVTVVQRVGVRFYLTVAHPDGSVGSRAFELRALRWTGEQARRSFEAEIANTGSLLVEPLGSMTIARGDLRTSTDLPVLGTVPPGVSRNLRISQPGTLEEGSYEARLNLRLVQGGPAQERAITFVVAPSRGSYQWVAAMVAGLLLLVVAGALLRLTLQRRASRPTRSWTAARS